MPATMLQVKVIQSMQEVNQADWDALVGNGSPFLEWGWLSSMEDARCVTSKEAPSRLRSGRAPSRSRTESATQ